MNRLVEVGVGYKQLAHIDCRLCRAEMGGSVGPERVTAFCKERPASPTATDTYFTCTACSARLKVELGSVTRAPSLLRSSTGVKPQKKSKSKVVDAVKTVQKKLI